jgi:rod shape-determining protein MreC
VKAGDVVVTSGLDGIYPRGLVVGRVSSVAAPSGLFKEVLVTPAVAFDRTEAVLVIKSPAPDRRVPESVR